MKFSALRRTAVCLAAALLFGGAWAFHMAGSAPDAAHDDCQVCAVASAPELNADCGTELVSRPENFTLVARAPVVTPANTLAVLCFYGRAPPSA